VAGVLAAALLAQGCAGSIPTPNMNEGEEYLRAARKAPPLRPAQPVAHTEPIPRLALFTTAQQEPFRAHWNPRSEFKDSTALEGMGTGFYVGLNLLSVLPIFVITPYVLGGILGISTAVGGIAGAAQSGKGSWKPPADHGGLEDALARMRPDADVREMFREEVQRITGKPAPMVTQPAGETKDEPPDYGALGKAAGADAVADLRVVAFGLAGGDVHFSLAVFMGVRARVFRASDGALIYDKLVAQSPDLPLPEMPPPASYTLEMHAMDDGRVFRHETRQALSAIARAIATDPALQLTPVAATAAPPAAPTPAPR
jgi:hypothetical protein